MANKHEVHDRAGTRVGKWSLKDLAGRAFLPIAGGDEADEPVSRRIVEGRFIELLASPELGNSRFMAVGMSAVPAGLSTPAHSHISEEFAVVISGSGVISIDGCDFAVETGDVVLVPSGVPHVTCASPTDALVVLWVYAPPGSEKRWLEPAS